MSILFSIILYFIGGFLTLFFHYEQTDSKPEVDDILLFFLWPFAVFLMLVILILIGPMFLAHKLARKIKNG